MEEREGKVVLPALLDVKQVSEYLGLHRVTVVEFARLGKLPAFKVGREWRFRADAIREWLDRQAGGTVGGRGEDEFDRLWKRLGEQANRARVTPEDVPYVIAEVRGSGPPEGAARPHRGDALRLRSGQAEDAES